MTEYVPDDKTRAQVRAMAAYGINHAGICSILSLTPFILRTYYHAECIAGPIEAEAKVRQALYTAAISGDVQAMKVWLEQNAGGF